jgi:hypothetical protein
MGCTHQGKNDEIKNKEGKQEVLILMRWVINKSH